MSPFSASGALGPGESPGSLPARALRGDVRAQWRLALACRNGRDGSPKDIPAAMAWLECAARGGCRDAMVLLGTMIHSEARTHESENPPSRALAKAAFWFLKAHRAGHPAALAELDRLLSGCAGEAPWAEVSRDPGLDRTQAALDALLGLPWQQDYPAHRRGPVVEVDLRIPRLVRLRCPVCSSWATPSGLDADRWEHVDFEGGPVVLVVHRPQACCTEHGLVPVVLPASLVEAGFKWIPTAGDNGE